MTTAKVVPFKEAKLKAPIDKSGTVKAAKRKKSSNERDYLTVDEVEQLRKLTKNGRNSHRDSTMILVAFRHGYRACEITVSEESSIDPLKWSDIDLDRGFILVRRAKGSNDSKQPLKGDEIRALRRLKREAKVKSPYVFITESGDPMSHAGYRKMLNRLGKKSDIEIPVRPHALRHGCGHYMADKGVDTRAIQDWLGHASITHTVRYTRLSEARFLELGDIW